MCAPISMQAFRVSGKFRMGHILTPFSLETLGTDEKGARERVFSTIGSRHRANRHQIFIEKVEPLSADKVSDPVVEKKISMVK
ncbi:MAG TPA: 50S ribosomal protein L18Ae [Candidatus Thermoplasmatota archaeon]|nr:50S ribosomal protein L18Ae [Candidatus Thermoplasmatota archaeon]